MRWDELFSDLEAQASALSAAERAGEIAERTRSEFARLSMADRLRSAVGTTVRVGISGRSPTAPGRLVHFHPEWILLAQPHGNELLIPVSRIELVVGVGRSSSVVAQTSPVEERLGLRFALRRIARDRSGVRCQLSDVALDGTIDRVGRDFFELATHPVGEARRRDAVLNLVLVRSDALVSITRLADR